jgi:hypothetical protein
MFAHIRFVAHFSKALAPKLHPIVTLPENVILFFAVMPAKTTSAPKQDLFPRITGTLRLKWDISNRGKVFLHTTDGAISLLGYSAVAQVLKFDMKLDGATTQVRKKDACLLA